MNLNAVSSIPLHKYKQNKPYTCDECLKPFQTPSKLRRHYLIHTGQKPFECSSCFKTFRQLVHLKKHQATHAGVYKCTVCQKNFKQLGKFRIHQQIHKRKIRFSFLDKYAAKPVVKLEKPDRVTSSDLLKYHDSTPLAQNDSATKKKVHNCEFCKKAFQSPSKLKRHLLIHTGQKPFQCLICGKSFRQLQHLKVHQVTHSASSPYSCPICERKFRRHTKLLSHMQVHTENTSLLNPEHEMPGSECYSRLQPVPDYEGSSKTSSLDDDDDDDSVDNLESDGAQTVYTIPFECPFCEQSFETENLLSMHSCAPSVKRCTKTGENTGNWSTECLIENKKFVTSSTSWHLTACEVDEVEESFTWTSEGNAEGSSEMHRHYNTHVGDEAVHQCGDCNNVFTDSLSLQKHLQSHEVDMASSDALTKECSIFSNEFHSTLSKQSVGNISVHQRAGPKLAKNKCYKPKQYKCDKCEKEFACKSKFKRHYLIHTGQKPYACSFCSKRFRQSTHLKNHLRMHTEDRPYKCALCQLGFKSKYKLLNHHKEHSEPETDYSFSFSDQKSSVLKSSSESKLHKCGFCVKHFPSPSKLRRHLLIHTGQRPFHCLVCGRTFRQLPHLKSHQAVHSGASTYKCTVCSAIFEKTSLLLSHMQTHSESDSFSINGRFIAVDADSSVSHASEQDFGDLAENDHSQINGIKDYNDNAQTIYTVPFECYTCESLFESDYMLKIHKCISSFGTSVVPQNYTSDRQSEGSTSYKPSEKHFQLSNNDKRSFDCNICYERFWDSTELHKHEEVHNIGNKFYCDICEETFNDFLSFRKHVQLHEERAVSKSTFTDEAVSKQALKVDGFYQPVSLDSVKATRGKPRLYKCGKCGKEFSCKSKFKRHYLIHTGQKPFACLVCGKRFRQSSHLKSHQRMHSEDRPYKCTVCQVGFKNVFKFLYHQVDHMKSDTSQCSPLLSESDSCQENDSNWCEKSSQNQCGREITDTNRNQFLDAGILKLQCPLCKKYFQSQQNLQKHQCSSSEIEAVGLGKKLYKCTVCCKSFRSPSKLEAHFLIHIGQKPFECVLCGRTFRQTSHLKRHHLTHAKDGPFTCGICYKTFSGSIYLQQHYDVHHV
ncbi:zinc finger protein 770-like [Protopterus annectens]|uniref:zinc finger protein 770-like n=1 Tax=Protopterus annectens TaxID=7888 RepID=UPI001CFB6D4E|nr:zinc finger protein 770-like [Protopterus annectens]XP_043929811.1 zinc finger protein 770-like [Protopterus annectens]